MYLVKDERDWTIVSMSRLPAIVHAGSARGLPPDTRELQVSIVKNVELSLLLLRYGSFYLEDVLSFWDVAPCRLVVCRHFKGACYLHLQGHEASSTILHSTISQKTVIFIFATVRT
jgi:hypothetical protein